MNEVIVATYCENGSYGSVVQALGLKKGLLELGCNSRLIADLPYEPIPVHKVSLKRKVKGTLAQLVKIPSKGAVKKKLKHNRAFIAQHMDTCLLKEVSAEAVFLAGSDQIWHPYVRSKVFFGEGLPEGMRKVSYAASMGVLEIPAEKETQFRQLIGNFDVLSVREKSCVPVLQKFTDKEIGVHIDPSFFLRADQWGQYERSYAVEKPYILVFPIYWDPAYNEQLKKLHRETGKEIVVLGDYRRKIFATQWAFDADVGQFLWLLHHADAVVSSSFHGTALALNYNKKVAAVVNPSAASRIEDLFTCLGYQNSAISDLTKDDVDWEYLNGRIKEEKERAMAYLKEALLI